MTGTSSAQVRVLRRSVDFEAVLARKPSARTEHFAVHHAPHGPAPFRSVPAAPVEDKLSTGTAPSCAPAVDDFAAAAPRDAAAGVIGWWLGMIVPKRHARRSVTRNLIKRQIRSAFVLLAREREAPHGEVSPRFVDLHPPVAPLGCGLWVVRLRSGFDVRQFPSASSAALRQVVRAELAALLAHAARPAERAARRPRADPRA